MKLSPSKAGTNYTSPNYFMEMASEHMNAKVSPYLAFLSTVRTKLPAVERLVLGEGGFTNDTSTTYLDKNGDVVKRKDLSKQQKTLLKAVSAHPIRHDCRQRLSRQYRFLQCTEHTA